MPEVKTSNRLRKRKSSQRYSEPGVHKLLTTAKQAQKPARLMRHECEHLLLLLQRVAAGGDATVAVDAARAVPLLQRAVTAAPHGQRGGRTWYVVAWPNGTVERQRGAAAVAERIGRGAQTVRNALSKGRGRASFPHRDENLNPCEIVVRKAEEN